MKIPAIKKLVETTSVDELIEAEQDVMDEKQLKIEVEGDDEGEKLTHILAAIWVKNDMVKNGTDFRAAIRNYSVKVRNTIS